MSKAAQLNSHKKMQIINHNMTSIYIPKANWKDEKYQFFYKKGEQRERSFPVGENVNWYNYFAKLEVSDKAE